MDRKAAKAFVKALPAMEYFICTNYGISQISHRSSVKTLGGTSQGNSISGAICRDISCLIFKLLELKKFGAIMKEPGTERRYQRVVIAFVDDADFCLNGELCEHCMSKIMESCTKLCKATRGKIQLNKIVFYCWRWAYQNREQTIEQLEATVIVYGEKIKSIPVMSSIRTLGVCLNPALN